ncbi:MAG TPA: hypothetical protein VIC06_10355 [Solirubrobacteraceae bacterium]
MASDPGKHLCAFDLDRLERLWIQPEQVEDRRRDLVGDPVVTGASAAVLAADVIAAISD